jgi:hypothetical protein
MSAYIDTKSHIATYPETLTRKEFDETLNTYMFFPISRYTPGTMEFLMVHTFVQANTYSEAKDLVKYMWPFDLVRGRRVENDPSRRIDLTSKEG